MVEARMILAAEDDLGVLPEVKAEDTFQTRYRLRYFFN